MIRKLVYILIIVVVLSGIYYWYARSGPVPMTPATVQEYSAESYQAAQARGKVVVLFFYANWCPSCFAEEQILEEVAAEYPAEKLAVFAINFKDSEVIADEEQLAANLKITEQVTKVFIRSGQEILRSTEHWDKSRYLIELDRALKV